MKKSIFITALVVTTLVTLTVLSLPVLADDANWSGTTGSLSNLCTFEANTAGVMTYDDATKKWTVTTPAYVTIKVRNAVSVQAVAGTQLTSSGQSNVPATPNFVGADTDMTRDTKNGATITPTIAAGNVNKTMSGENGIFVLALGGVVQINDLSWFAGQNLTYAIAHTVTCTH